MKAEIELAIPYAIMSDGNKITASQLSSFADKTLGEMRVSAVAAKRVGASKFECPICNENLYPHKGGTVHWQHFAGTVVCLYRSERKISRAQLEASIYRGRKKGPRHQKLVEMIVEMLHADPDVDRSSITIEKYEEPISENSHGRFPDVRCKTARGSFVFEVQTSPILLYRIFDRIEFYKNNGDKLLWITDVFDVSGAIPTYFWDLVATQKSNAFDVPIEVFNESLKKNRFQLREVSNFTDLTALTTRIVTLKTLALEHCEFAEDWIRRRPSFDRHSIPQDLKNSLRVNLLPSSERVEDYYLCQLVDWLLSIETGLPVGYRFKDILGVINAALSSNFGKRCVGLIEMSIKRYRPDILTENDWILKKINDARYWNQQIGNAKQFTRESWVGQIRAFILPSWELPARAKKIAE